MSLLAAAWRLGLPATVHVAIGTDIVHMHPACDPAAVGRATHLDFRLLAGEVARLGGGGVYLNVGSAVLLPEVFLKAVTLARNLGHDLSDFATANLDFIQSYRPNTNVVQRPTAGRGPRLQPHRPPRDHGQPARRGPGGGTAGQPAVSDRAPHKDGDDDDDATRPRGRTGPRVGLCRAGRGGREGPVEGGPGDLREAAWSGRTRTWKATLAAVRQPAPTTTYRFRIAVSAESVKAVDFLTGGGARRRGGRLSPTCDLLFSVSRGDRGTKGGAMNALSKEIVPEAAHAT